MENILLTLWLLPQPVLLYLLIKHIDKFNKDLVNRKFRGDIPDYVAIIATIIWPLWATFFILLVIYSMMVMLLEK